MDAQFPTSIASLERMDLRSAAEYLGVGERFLRRLVFEKRITYYKLGPGRRSPLRFDRADLDEYLRLHRYELKIS